MADVNVNGRSFDIDLIIFDKDGTLIDLNHLWSQQMDRWAKLMKEALSLEEGFFDDLFQQVGYDVEARRLIPDQLAAVATIQQFVTIAAFYLYRHGVGWTEAEEKAQWAADQSLAAPPEVQMLKLLGDVHHLFTQLKQHGIRIAVMTSDERIGTEATLALLGLDNMIDSIVCADDPIPNKPAPDGVWHISKITGVSPERMLMVGDSTGDMRAGQAAGVQGVIGIGEAESGVTAVADEMISSIDEIQIRMKDEG